jgi:hypothetical protein
MTPVNASYSGYLLRSRGLRCRAAAPVAARTTQLLCLVDHEARQTLLPAVPQVRGFRRQVEDAGLACWNLSDYALLCWLSADRTTTALTRLWRTPDDQLTAAGHRVTGILTEKTGAAVPADAASFVSGTRELAAGSAPEAGGQ